MAKKEQACETSVKGLTALTFARPQRHAGRKFEPLKVLALFLGQSVDVATDTGGEKSGRIVT